MNSFNMGKKTDRRLRIAMVGQRGVPATYGGVERHVEEIGAGLASAGHSVTIYCRRGYSTLPKGQYRGMQIRYTPYVPGKSLEALTHSLSATVAAIASRADVVHYHAIGPGIFSPLVRLLTRKKVVQTVHGLDQDRQKWGLGAQLLLSIAAVFSSKFPHCVITVSEALRVHYARTYNTEAVYIPNGAGTPAVEHSQQAHDDRNTLPYYLFVGRIVPEKSLDLLLDAFAATDVPAKLVVIGGPAASLQYYEAIKERAERDPRVILRGYLYGRELAGAYSEATFFVSPSSLEGLPIVLLEAISYNVPVIASDIEPHLEILKTSRSGVRIFASGDLEALRSTIIGSFDERVEARADMAKASSDLLAPYDWRIATEKLERVYLMLLEDSNPAASAEDVAE